MARHPKALMPALAGVRTELERILIQTNYFVDTPFSWIGISIRFGMKTEAKPHFQHIDRKDGELPLAIEIETAQMIGADLEQLKNLFRSAALRALIAAAERYNCPDARLREMFASLPTPQSSAEEDLD
ncbi:MAG: immunity protein 39 [Phycisphaeraceae bacterium]|nr:immunity protein 39 [Phycisphaeraceae bacterium]MCW5763150.1 immunity protein 39 [Phycisphaeraceae bacterium]